MMISSKESAIRKKGAMIGKKKVVTSKKEIVLQKIVKIRLGTSLTTEMKIFFVNKKSIMKSVSCERGVVVILKQCSTM